MEGMRGFRPILLLSAVLVAVSPAAANATVNTSWQSPARTPGIVVERESDGAQMLDSLREDVAKHPDDFVTFQTQTAALRFIDEHGLDANRETARRTIERGVLGYWRGKMVVVVPIAAVGGRRRL